MTQPKETKETPKSTKKAYLTLAPLRLKNAKGQPVDVEKDKIVRLVPEKAQALVASAQITSSWTDWLSDSERKLLPQATRQIMSEQKTTPEEAEVRAVRKIIKDRIIAGKCDQCDRKDWCMLTKGQRALCEVQKKV
jgi:hypothetical protein